MKNKALGIVLAIAGIILFSSKAVMVKMAYQYEVETISLLLLRMSFALPVYVLIAFSKKPKNSISRKDFLWIVTLGIIGYYLASYLDFLGLKYIKAGLERLILFVYPTLVLIISYLFLKERISQKQVLGVAISYIGIIAIYISEFQVNQDEGLWLGAILVFLSALSYAGYLVGSGRLIPKVGATQFTSYAMIVSCLVVIAHYGIQGSENILELSSEVYWIGFFMAIFATVIPSYLISYAINLLGANKFSVFGSLGPVSTIVLAYFFLNETLTLIQLVGAVVIIFGIFLAERKVR